MQWQLKSRPLNIFKLTYQCLSAFLTSTNKNRPACIVAKNKKDFFPTLSYWSSWRDNCTMIKLMRKPPLYHIRTVLFFSYWRLPARDMCLRRVWFGWISLSHTRTPTPSYTDIYRVVCVAKVLPLASYRTSEPRRKGVTPVDWLRSIRSPPPIRNSFELRYPTVSLSHHATTTTIMLCVSVAVTAFRDHGQCV